jgi:hypothetical protein
MKPELHSSSIDVTLQQTPAHLPLQVLGRVKQCNATRTPPIMIAIGAKRGTMPSALMARSIIVNELLD